MNNRQAGRRRGRGGQRPGTNSGSRDNGNRIDNRSRGNAAQLLEKYKSLASDAQRAGDRVNTEYYLQFADHYFRVLAETRSRFEENRRPGDEDSNEDEFGYEGEIASPGNQVVREDRYDDRGERPERGNDSNDRGNDRDRPQGRDQNRDQNRDRGNDRQAERGDRNTQRNDRGGNDRSGNDRGGNDRSANERGDRDGNARREPRRDDRPRYANDGDDAPRAEARPEPRNEPRPEPRSEPRDERPAPTSEEPRRRGRPRRDAAPVEAEVTTSGFDAALLPPSIAIETAPVANDDEAPRPRRRRVRTRDDEEMTPPAA